MAAISYDMQWVDIVNRALTRVGLTQISNLDEGSSGANYGSQLLPQAIETVYSAYHWRDATKYVQLVPLAEKPAYGYLYQYPLPEDFALIKSVEVSEAYEYMDKKILTNATEVFVSYVALPKLPSDMTPLLSDMVVRQLAYLISIPMVKNDAISNRIYSEFQQLHAMAMTREGIAQHEEGNAIGWYDESR
ncbi:hypothetical protein [Sphaerochaeta sp.]|uniref:hypothetical protein n=1 Tax=Sphaerochaeta sp. TaxID=1972642 RepID=UPI003D110A2B